MKNPFDGVVFSRDDITALGQELRAIQTNFERWVEELSARKKLRVTITNVAVGKQTYEVELIDHQGKEI